PANQDRNRSSLARVGTKLAATCASDAFACARRFRRAFLERSVAFMKRYSDFTNVVATGLWPVHTPHGFTPAQPARKPVATANRLVPQPPPLYLLIPPLLL